MRLTDLQIQRLKPETDTKQKTYFDDTVKGFGLRVSVGGAKTFVVMYGKRRRLETLGRYPDLSLADARKKAKERLGAVVQQGDAPLPSIAFPEARERFLEDARMRTKRSTYAEYYRLLHKHFTFPKPLSAITRADIMVAIERLNAVPGTASHAFMAMKAFMNWAVSRGLVSVSPMPRLRFSIRSRSRILSDDELRLVWHRAEEVGYPYGTIIKLLILTGQRRGEIAGLRRSWIRDDAITFPVGFCKNKREHRIPIGLLTKEIIDAIPGDTDLLFPARGKPDRPFNGWSKAKAEFDRPLSLPPYTLHDLRRTYSSNLAKLGVPIHVTEKLLNHVSGTISGVAAVYNRHSYWEEMRKAAHTGERHLI